MSVDLPEPEEPTRAVTEPGSAVNDIPLSTGRSGWYSNQTSRNSTAPRISGSGSRSFSPASSGTSFQISRMRSRPANASVIWLPMLTIEIAGPTKRPR